MIVNHFINFFSTNHSFSNNRERLCNQIGLNRLVVNLINECCSKEEIWAAANVMHPIKCPAPDGIQPISFQKFWTTVGSSITELIGKCYDTTV